MSEGEIKFGAFLIGALLFGFLIYTNSGAIANALGIIAVIAVVVICVMAFFLMKSDKGIYK